MDRISEILDTQSTPDWECLVRFVLKLRRKKRRVSTVASIYEDGEQGMTANFRRTIRQGEIPTWIAEQEKGPASPVGALLRSKDSQAAALISGRVDHGFSPQDMRGGATQKAPGT